MISPLISFQKQLKKKGTKTKWELVGHRIVLKVTAILCGQAQQTIHLLAVNELTKYIRANNMYS